MDHPSPSRTEATAPLSDELFRAALEAAPTGMLMMNAAGRIVFANAQVEQLFGHPRGDLIGGSIEMLLPERYRSHDDMTGYLDDPQPRTLGVKRELFGLRKDGSEIPVEVGLTPLHTPAARFVLCSILDTTGRRRAFEQSRERSEDLSASLRERDLLLQEVHHRVKNNLQLISSLINMQARKVQNVDPRQALAECKRRVEAIGLIHEKLYHTHNYAEVPFSDYVRSLAANLMHAADGSAMELIYECDQISLPVDKAISCGLLLNELITNALKHAYPDGASGKLHIELRKVDGKIRLAVRDSGVGMPEEHRAASSLGLQLVNMLSDQLNGTLTTEVSSGTEVRVTFPA